MISTCLAILLSTIFVSGSTPSPNILCPQDCSCLSSMVACSRQRLREVPTDLPSWTTVLELQTNRISYLRDNSFSGLDHLESLDISNNRLRNISDGVFRTLDKLTILEIYRNKLSSIPAIANRLPNLDKLIIHHNLIQNVSSADFAGLSQLRVLDLNTNRLSSLSPYVFASLTSLQELYLDSNRLTRLPAVALANLTNLRVLKLSKNNIGSFEAFPKLPLLRLLDLDGNRIRAIPSLAFDGLGSLQEIFFRHNEIVKLNAGAFYGLSSIHVLDLSWNAIGMVDQPWLYGLENLRELILSHNHINSTNPEGFKFCTFLEKMNLSSNRLETLEADGLSELSNLRYLYIDNNRIANIEDGAFRGLQNLQTLVLRDNIISWQIEDMTGAFEGLEELQVLDIANNNLRHLPVGAFIGLDSLRKLDMRGNDIATIQENPFDDAPELQELFMNTTELFCDCQVAWFADWIRETGLTREVAGSCSYPSTLVGRDIFQIEKADLVCDMRPQPYIVQQPEAIVALRGDNVSLVCIAATTSDAELTVVWRKDTKQLKDANPLNIASKGPGDINEFTSVLSLPNVNDDNQGRYQCVFINEFGKASTRKVKVTVHVFPTFIKKPENVRQRVGGSAKLECSASGQPTPEIAWRKDGGSDFPAALDRRFHVLPHSDKFFIVELKQADMGVYSCSATNSAGTIVANATLTVLQDPYFVEPLLDQQVTLGETAVLECIVDGSPPPTIEWLKDGELFDPLDRHRLAKGGDGHFVIIIAAQKEDEGKYTCRATNSENTVEGTATLTMQTEGALLLSVTTTTGIIIIAVVCCIVGTSIIWVIIIYQTRKLRRRYAPASSDNTSLPAEIPSTSLNGSSEGTIHQETSSGVSSEATDKYQQENSDCDSMEDINRGDHVPFPHHVRTAAIFPSEMGIADPPEYNICNQRIPEECMGEQRYHQLPHNVEIHRGPIYPSEYLQNTHANAEEQPFLEINELARQRHLSDQEDLPLNLVQVRSSEMEPLQSEAEENKRLDQMSISSANTYPAMPRYIRSWRDVASDEDASHPRHQSPNNHLCAHKNALGGTDSLKPPSPQKHRTRKARASEKPAIHGDKMQSKKCPSHRKMDSGRRIGGPNRGVPQSSFSTSQLPVNSSTSLDVPAVPYHSLQRLSTSTEV